MFPDVHFLHNSPTFTSICLARSCRSRALDFRFSCCLWSACIHVIVYWSHYMEKLMLTCMHHVSIMLPWQMPIAAPDLCVAKDLRFLGRTCPVHVNPADPCRAMICIECQQISSENEWNEHHIDHVQAHISLTLDGIMIDFVRKLVQAHTSSTRIWLKSGLKLAQIH